MGAKPTTNSGVAIAQGLPPWDMLPKLTAMRQRWADFHRFYAPVGAPTSEWLEWNVWRNARRDEIDWEIQKAKLERRANVKRNHNRP